MATYKKTLRSLEITLINNAKYNVVDTVDCAAASDALADFKAGGVMSVVVEDELHLIPASAVGYIKLSSSQSDDIVKPEIC